MGEVQGSPPAPPWSDLPSELLGLVFLCLPTRADRAFFHGVCRTWCYAARHCRLPPLSPVPWLVLPDGSATSLTSDETFQLPAGMRYHNSCGEWLLLSRNDDNRLLMNQFTKATMPLPSLSSQSSSGNDDSYFLMNLFTKATMPLPSLSSRSYCKEPVEVIEGYMHTHYFDRWLNHFYSNVGGIYVVSLVVCSTRLIVAIVDVSSFRTISLCRPGAGAWSVVKGMECSHLSDMVFLEGKIYAFDRTTSTADLIAIDIVDEYDNEPRVSQIKRLIKGIPYPCRGYMPYLLESHGTLLMIYRKECCKIECGPGIPATDSSKFVVFKADLERHLWVEMWTLGNDQALFLGRGCSRAVRVSPFDHLSRDCIFYLPDSIGWFGNMRKAVRTCELYDMKDGKIYLPLPLVTWESRKAPATWIFSQGETDEAAGSTGNCGT